MIIVSYKVDGQTSPEDVEGFITSCKDFSLDPEIYEMMPTCCPGAQKADVIGMAIRSGPDRFLFSSITARFRRDPFPGSLVERLLQDDISFATRRSGEPCTDVIFVNKNERVVQFVSKWGAECRKNPTDPDWKVFLGLLTSNNLTFGKLPMTYCCESGSDHAVIEFPPMGESLDNVIEKVKPYLGLLRTLMPNIPLSLQSEDGTIDLPLGQSQSLQDYDIVASETPAGLARGVRDLLRMGWRPYGHPYFDPELKQHCQAIVK